MSEEDNMPRRKTPALIAAEVDVPGSDSSNPIEIAMKLLQKENERLTKANDELMKMLAVNYANMVESQVEYHRIGQEWGKQHIENIRIREQLMNEADERALKREREKAHNELMLEIGGEIKALLPVVVNKLAKHPVLNANDASALKPFVESLSEQQLTSILQTLNPAQRAALIALLDQLEPEAGNAQN